MELMGGVDAEIRAIRDGQPIDLGQKSYFKLLSHRDTAIAMILALQLAGNPVAVRNLSGHTVDVGDMAFEIEEYAKRPLQHQIPKSQLTGKKSGTALLADDSRVWREIYTAPTDSLRDIVHAQTYWVLGGGYRREGDQHIGQSMEMKK